MKYASNTHVPVDRSKSEIERLLQRYGAVEMANGWKSDKAIMQFKMNERVVRFVLPLPARSDYVHSETGRVRTDTAATQAWEQACRQRWRALALTINAKLESAESGIEEFETALMGQIVMPNGKTISEQVLPMIETAYTTRKMPALMLEY